jgi:phosphatidylglycerophosphatase A
VIATGLGSGYSPVAPGTAGSLVGLLLFWPLAALSLPVAAGVGIVLFGVGWWASDRVARLLGIEDPGVVVVDEVFGMFITLIGLPLSPWVVVLGFLLFRGLDIVKPYPAAAMEHLPGGLGIMADDLVAGVYANLLLRVALLVWPLAA